MEFMWVYDREREGKELKEENKGREKKKEKREHRKKNKKKRRERMEEGGSARMFLMVGPTN